jgi:hypothetical protein
VSASSIAFDLEPVDALEVAVVRDDRLVGDEPGGRHDRVGRAEGGLRVARDFIYPELPGVDLDVIVHRAEVEFVDPQVPGDASIRVDEEVVVDVGAVDCLE